MSLFSDAFEQDKTREHRYREPISANEIEKLGRDRFPEIKFEVVPSRNFQSGLVIPIVNKNIENYIYY